MPSAAKAESILQGNFLKLDCFCLKSGLVSHSSKKGGGMEQLHRRFTDEQVKALFKRYCQVILDRAVIEEILEIGRSRFFTLLKEYRHNPDTFSIAYQRETPTRGLFVSVEKQIKEELMLEKSLIDDPTLPITTYNYSAIRDRLANRRIIVALSTIIGRAKSLDC